MSEIFLLLWLCLPLMVLVVGYLLFLPVWLAVLGRLKSLRRRPLVFLSVPAYILLLVLLHAWGTGRFAPVHSTFREAMGYDPPADVSDLQTYRSVWGDFGIICLRFKAGRETVERIVARGLKPMEEGESPIGTNAHMPAWFTPPTTGVLRYHAKFEKRRFHSECEYLVHDPQSGETFFRYMGVD